MADVIYTPGVSHSDSAQFGLTLQYLAGKSPVFAFFYPQIYGKTFLISSQGPNMVMPASGQIFWNPSKGLQVISETGVIGVQSAAMGLVHEFGHLIFGHNEAAATAWETSIARELGEPIRANYLSTGVEMRVENSTLHTENGTWKAFQKNNTFMVGGQYNGETFAPYLGSGVAPPGPPVPGWGGWHSGNTPIFMGDYGPIDTSYPYQPPPGTIPNPLHTPDNPLAMEFFTGAELSLKSYQMISTTLDSSPEIKTHSDLDGELSLTLGISGIDHHSIEENIILAEASPDLPTEASTGVPPVQLIGLHELAVL
jgi:hypothetical protein